MRNGKKEKVHTSILDENLKHHTKKSPLWAFFVS